MKKWNVVKIIGFMSAIALIVFGSVSNFLRAIKFGWNREKKKK